MKMQGVIDLEKFLKLLDGCEGQVLMVTENGDRFNMTSKISQYVAVTKILSQDEIPEVEIIANNPEDEKKLIAFLTK